MTRDDDSDAWLSSIELSTVFAMLRDNGAREVLYKVLPSNANSKNQVYLSSDLSQLGKIPSGDVTLHISTSRKGGGAEAVLQSALEFYWVAENGIPCRAPNAKLIFYPQYPEVRFSGFLMGCGSAPSSLYSKERRGTESGRILVIGIGNDRRILGITLPPESPAAREIHGHEPRDAYGALWILPLVDQERNDGYLDLMRELCRIHHREWVPSTRLNSQGELVPCRATNCNGNTLESLLGIRSNGYSLPDFRGWEVKARSVGNTDKPGAGVVTLFTPEPTNGLYVERSFVEFMRLYAYPDTKGRADRVNFGGVYRCNQPAHAKTGLRLVLDGFDADSGKYNLEGAIRLLDRNNTEAMAWSFVKLMDHWKTKHAQAVFVPSQQRAISEKEYRFGRKVLLGEGAEFRLFLEAVHRGAVYYDPGIKLEGATSAAPLSKRRSQFRVKSGDLPALYTTSKLVDACEEADR